MQRSKHLAMMFLLGAVLVGGALGFTADRVWMQDPLPAATPAPRRALLYDRLELNAVQRAAWDSILDDRHRQFDSLFKPIKPQMDSDSLARPRADPRAAHAGAARAVRGDHREPRPNEKRETPK